MSIYIINFLLVVTALLAQLVEHSAVITTFTGVDTERSAVRTRHGASVLITNVLIELNLIGL